MSTDLDKAEKYIGSCCGNKFIILDCRNIKSNRQEKVIFSKKNIVKYDVDSALFIGNANGYDFSLEIFEKDGSESDSCGNGMILVSYLLELKKGKVKMKGSSVVVEGNFTKQSILMDVGYSKVKKIPTEKNCLFVKMGEPHIIYLVDNLDKFYLTRVGKNLQKKYPGGVNVDAVQKKDESHYLIKTYERGVFSETKSCGTGSLSSFIAISSFYNRIYKHPIEFRSKGGIHFVSKIGDMLKLETLKKFCEIKTFKNLYKIRTLNIKSLHGI